MAETALTTVRGTGTQATTQSPQAATGQAPGSAGTQAKSVQPGTATSVLNSTEGIALQSQPLTTVSLGATTQAKASAPVVATPPKQQVNPAFLGISLLLCLIAVVLFWTTMRSGKNTTKYS